MDKIIQEAESKKSSYLTFLLSLLESEVKDRTKKTASRILQQLTFRLRNNLKLFEFNRIKGISKIEINNLLDCGWLDRKQNILLFGPPGIGKTHIGIALGFVALNKGYTVCFERVTSLMHLFKVSSIQKQAEHRIKKIMKANLIIIDEIGYTPIDKKEANLFFNLISEVYEKSSIILTSNKSFENWAEMLGDTTMTAALLDRLYTMRKYLTYKGILIA
ncbi:MAG: ATP-binding protein [Leptospiraceae bacterium]|nr:ATP-binding protein [Leptospiraceae bacterium]